MRLLHLQDIRVDNGCSCDQMDLALAAVGQRVQVHDYSVLGPDFNGSVLKLQCLDFMLFFSGVFSQGVQIDCAEFQDPKVHCTRESNPHCGSDGRTYGNKCTFCKAMVKSGGKLSLKHHGKC
ncbi:serine protease inhibitor Kazal-type 6 [Phocoena sinus]|uniref:serine protease inhibitor Kazal-type 6 n=1 Tax=Phocoena sinus TaxID=42100 RepID=UPI0013C46D0B|nr:serine protease inhibitor Kazal-type 6 [Phocoena sinus]